MNSVLQEAQQVQEGLNNSARDCQTTIIEYRKQINLLEKQAQKLFDGVTGRYDGTTYHYSIDTIGTEEDTSLKCHYVNVRILFEVLNVK